MIHSASRLDWNGFGRELDHHLAAAVEVGLVFVVVSGAASRGWLVRDARPMADSKVVSVGIGRARTLRVEHEAHGHRVP